MQVQSYSIRRRIRALLAALIVFYSSPLHSGGVFAVAGTSGFDPNVAGKPITWANAQVPYYTDQGNLSPALDQAGANDFVASAFQRWTAVPSASLAAARAGSLDQDVNGSNVFVSEGTLNLPADIQETATHKPLAVIYDSDGSVTDALLGAGAGSTSLCGSNAVFGGADRYTTSAHFAHSLIVINGNCAQQSSELPWLKYRLVRTVGQVLGVGWSQLNDNVYTGSPAPSADDLTGFPLMHPIDPACGGAVITCLPDADQLRMDDRAAIAYLYPAPAASTARISGSVYFRDERGMAGQPMQGVNVVARLMDPVTGQPSKVTATASVSGFLFRGNHGNPVTGFAASPEQSLAAFGSDDAALRGHFDLAGLEIPQGQSAASYQLAVEAVNPLYKGDSLVGPYRTGGVSPSGSFLPVVVTGLAAGASVQRNLVMTDSARLSSDMHEPDSFASPTPVPKSGEWWSRFGNYGDYDFYSFRAKPDRTFHFRVTALAESFVSSNLKAQPVIGLWLRSDPPDSAPLFSADPFNTVVTGQTKLSGQTYLDSELMVGIADLRGDGRPDFQYHARFFYADSVMPERIPAGGGVPMLIQGNGFHGNTTVQIGGSHAPVLHRTSSRLLVQTPALNNGDATVTVTDQSNGDMVSIQMGAHFGTTASDQIYLLSGGNSATPIGSAIANPMRVRVTSDDGVTPVPNVPVVFTVSPQESLFTACGANPCTVTTHALGEAQTGLNVRTSGAITLTASINNGKQVVTTVVGSNPVSTLHSSAPVKQLALGSTRAVLLNARALNSGIPAAGVTVSYSITTPPSSGTATLTSPTAISNDAGDVANSLNVTALGGGTTILACLPQNTFCMTFNVLAVPAVSQQLQLLSGGGQMLMSGQPLQPVVLRVVDSTTQRPVAGATVSLATATLAKVHTEDCQPPQTNCHSASPRPFATSNLTAISDDEGMVTLTPMVLPAWGAVDVHVLGSVGPASAQVVETTLQVFK